jgi:hypothetical protein
VRLAVLCVTVLAATVISGAAHAESCSKSRDYLLTEASDLPQRPSIYLALYRDCMDTLELPNVQDAFVLKVGAIAVIPKRDTVAATASTLAQFCERFPRGTLHFIKRKDRALAARMSKAVQMTAVNPTPCVRIKGGG